MERNWAIKTGSGAFLRKDGKIIPFKSPEEALRYIDRECGNSPYLTIELINMD